MSTPERSRVPPAPVLFSASTATMSGASWTTLVSASLATAPSGEQELISPRRAPPGDAIRECSQDRHQEGFLDIAIPDGAARMSDGSAELPVRPVDRLHCTQVQTQGRDAFRCEARFFGSMERSSSSIRSEGPTPRLCFCAVPRPKTLRASRRMSRSASRAVTRQAWRITPDFSPSSIEAGKARVQREAKHLPAGLGEGA